MECQKQLFRLTALLVVLSGHLALLMLWDDDRAQESPSTSRRSRLIFIPLSLPPEAAPQAKPPSRLREKRHTAKASSSSAQRDATIATPPIDWHAEGERAAQSAAPQWSEQQREKCKNPTMPALTPPECQPNARPHPWNPEPKAVGMDGLLPYARIGKRCVIGLGFFGCSLGKMPDADGHVLDGVHDPDRPKSSVPDVIDDSK